MSSPSRSISGVTALLKIEEVSTIRIEKVTDKLKLGQRIQAVVKKFDRDTGRIELSLKSAIGDFNTRVKNARKNLEKGAKIKASIKFKGRQISHPELAKDVLNRFSNELSDIADIELEPKLEGRSMYMQLTPKK